MSFIKFKEFVGKGTHEHKVTDEHIVTQFMATVAKTPDARALVFYYSPQHIVVLTYQELFNRAAYLATHIRERYLGKYRVEMPADTRIALCLPRTEWLICYQVAIALCGATEVPILPETKPSFIDEHLPALDCKLIITDNCSRALFSKNSFFCLSEPLIQQFRPSSINLKELEIQLFNYPYCLFSTGTSGDAVFAARPFHRLFHRNFMKLSERMTNEDAAINACVSSSTFDVYKSQMWMTLTTGKTLATLESPSVISELYTFIKTVTPTAIQMTNSLWYMLLSCTHEKAQNDKAFQQSMKSLLAINCGEALTLSVKDYLLTYCKSILDCYGLLEVGDCVATRAISRNQEGIITDSTFMQLPHLTIFCDQDGRLIIKIEDDLVPDGSTYFSPASVSRKRFKHSENHVLFYTEDIFNVTTGMFGKEFTFSHRASNSKQVAVKCDFETISNQITEFVLSKYQAKVDIFKSGASKSLILVSSKASEIVRNELEQHLTNNFTPEELPEIADIVTPEKFPMNRHMKCQKIDAIAVVEPSTDMEIWICNTLSKISGNKINCVNRTLNQLEDISLIESLNKLELQYFIYKVYNKNVTRKFLFNEKTTIQLLAKEILMLTEIKDDIIQPTDKLSSNEQRLLRVNNNFIVYHFPISGNPDVDHFSAAVDRIVAQHENLRTILELGDFTRKVIPKRENCLQIRKFEQNTNIEDIVALLRTTPGENKFNWQIILYTTESNQQHLFLQFHHVLLDSDGVDTFIHSLNASLANEKLISPPSPAELAAYKNRQHRDSEKKLTYWTQRLRLYNSMPLMHESLLPCEKAHSQRFKISPQTVKSLNRIAQICNVSSSDLLLAAVSILIYRYNGPSTTFAVADNARPPKFKNTLALAMELRIFDIEISDNPSVIELIRRAHKTFYNAAYNHPCVFGKVVDRILKRFPEIAVAIDMQDRPLLKIPNCDASKTTEYFPHPKNFSLIFHIVNGTVTIHAKSSQYSKTALEDLSNTFSFLLEQMTMHSSMSISDIPILTPKTQEIYAKFNEELNVEDPSLTLLQRFEQRAKNNPEALIYIDNENNETRCGLGDINANANQLAHYIAELHLEKKSAIAIALEQGPSAFESFFACHKTHMVPVHVNPNTTSSRIETQLYTIAPKLIITNKKPIIEYAIKHQVRYVDLSDQLTINNILSKSQEYQKAEVFWNHYAYYVFTSGTSNEPLKLVAITQKQIAIVVDHLLKNSELKFDSHTSYFNGFPIGTDGYIYTIICLVCAKILVDRTVYCDLAASRKSLAQEIDGRKAAQSIVNNAVSHAVVTPSVSRDIRPHLPKDSSVKLTVAGEDPFRTGLKSEDFSAALYGTAEATVIQSIHMTESLSKVVFKPPLGNPLPFVKFSFYPQTPIGGLTRLCLSGPTVGHYINMPNHPNFKTSKTGGSAFLTSDIVSLTIDANVVYNRRESAPSISHERLEHFIAEKCHDTVAAVCIVPTTDGQGANLFLEPRKTFITHDNKKSLQDRYTRRWQRYYDYLFTNKLPTQIIKEALTDFRTKTPYKQEKMIANIHRYLDLAFYSTEINSLCLVGCGIVEFSIIFDYLQSKQSTTPKEPMCITFVDSSTPLIASLREFFDTLSKKKKVDKTKFQFEFINCSIESLNKKLKNPVDCVLVLSVIQYLTENILTQFIDTCNELLTEQGILIFEDVPTMANREIESLEKSFVSAFLRDSEDLSATYNALQIKADNERMRQSELYTDPYWLKTLCDKQNLTFAQHPKAEDDHTKYRSRISIQKREFVNTISLSDLPKISAEKYLFGENVDLPAAPFRLTGIINPNVFLKMQGRLEKKPSKLLKDFYPDFVGKNADEILELLTPKNSLLHQSIQRIKMSKQSYELYLNDSEIEVIVGDRKKYFIETNVADHKLPHCNDPTLSSGLLKLLSNIINEAKSAGFVLPALITYFSTLIPRKQGKQNRTLLAQINSPLQIYSGQLPKTAESIRAIWAKEMGYAKEFIGPDTTLFRLGCASLSELDIMFRIVTEILGTTYEIKRHNEYVDINQPLIKIAEDIDNILATQKKSSDSKVTSFISNTAPPLTTDSSVIPSLATNLTNFE